MKKLLVLAATTAMLTSTGFADVENTFYGKVNVGGIILDKATDASTSIKMKSHTGTFAGLGVGYYVMDNIRTDLNYEHYFSPEMKKSQNLNNKEINAKHKFDIDALFANVVFDAFDVSVANVFAGGGVGVAMIKDKMNNSIVKAQSSKKTTNFAFQLIAGASFEAAQGVKMDLTYAYKDFGKTKGKLVNDVKTGTKKDATGNDVDVIGNVNTGKVRVKGHSLSIGARFEM